MAGVSSAAVAYDKSSVEHPAHYTAYKGVEVIDVTEQLNFNRGNAVKYICRAGLKDPDLWYVKREIGRVAKG